MTNQVRSLAAMAGEENTSADPQILRAYAIDGLLPGTVVRPGSAAEIAEILRFCAAEKLAVVPAGKATKLRMGMPPARYDVALVTTRLDKVVAYDPGDLTVSVEAGIALNAVTSLLAENRQLLPLVTPYLNQATVGGTVASGVDSPLRQLYGTARDFLLGMEFVTGDGLQAKSGGRVVKNVAGYDLHKLFIGSLGTLGVITRLNFKTFPAPETSGGFVAAFANETGALELLGKIRQSPLRASTVEVFNPWLASLFARRKASGAPVTSSDNPWIASSVWVLAASFGGSEAAMRRYVRELGAMAEAAGALESSVLEEGVRRMLWDQIREMVPLVLDDSPTATIFRLSTLPSKLGEIFAVAQRCGDRNNWPVAMLARGVGAAYVAFLPVEMNEETPGRLAEVADELAGASSAPQGFCSIAWCPAEMKTRAPIWGKERSDAAMMRNVKQAFDPENILSPGRFTGGL